MATLFPHAGGLGDLIGGSAASCPPQAELLEVGEREETYRAQLL